MRNCLKTTLKGLKHSYWQIQLPKAKQLRYSLQTKVLKFTRRLKLCLLNCNLWNWNINAMEYDQIVLNMEKLFNPATFVIRERYKFWSNGKRKPGESVKELAARIRQGTVTCDFSSITNPLDEALRTNFICSIKNEAVLKALFRIPEQELTFAKAVEVANEIEGAATVAKDTVYHSTSETIHTVQFKPEQMAHVKSGEKTQLQRKFNSNKTFKCKPGNANTKNRCKCYRCGSVERWADKCKKCGVVCNFCCFKGHYERVCFKKKPRIAVQIIKRLHDNDPLLQKVQFDEKDFEFELDSGTRDSFISSAIWTELGCPKLQRNSTEYRSATGNILPIYGLLYRSNREEELTRKRASLLTDNKLIYTVTKRERECER